MWRFFIAKKEENAMSKKLTKKELFEMYEEAKKKEIAFYS